MTEEEHDKAKEHLRSIAKKGGEALKKKYGKDHFSELGKKGMKNRWKIVHSKGNIGS